MTQTGDDIKAKAGRWTFGGDVAKNFDTHIKKSVPGYEEGHNLVAKLAPFFIGSENSKFLEIGCSTGSLTKRLGIPEGTVLEKPLLEYCLKKDELQDPLISKEHIFSFGWASEKEIIEIDKTTLRINDLLVGMFRGIGIKLIDFKIEYGKAWNKDTEKSEIVLADEISPDTCRLWDAKTEKKLDKDRFRKDLGNIVQAYQEVARRLGIMPEETNISEVNFGKTIPIKFKKK